MSIRRPLARLLLSLACAGVLFARNAETADLSKLPANRWVTLMDDEPGIIANSARFLWLPELNRGFLWPEYDYGSRHVDYQTHAQIHLFDPSANAWSHTATTTPDAIRTPQGDGVGLEYVWLEGLKRVLVLDTRNERGEARAPHVHSWLLDPKTGDWEPLTSDEPLRMCDISTDFHPVPFHNGLDRPRYGWLCYDGHNREAVLIGGSGTFGRVSKTPVAVEPGDWIYDETAEPKHLRRVLKSESGKRIEARRWSPANCGTWVFSEKDRQWRAIDQPIDEQPPGRILNAAVYHAGAKKIVLFGGENHQRVLADTWVYDCKTRRWRLAEPQRSPPARAAHALVYVPDQQVVLLAGGYDADWNPRTDTWIYRVETNEWTRLDLEIPAAGYYATADYAAGPGAVILCPHTRPRGRWPQPWAEKTTLLALKLDAATAPTAGIEPRDVHPSHHLVDEVPLPNVWRSKEENPPQDPEQVRRQLASLPANTWVLRQPPMSPKAKQWGSYAYDARTHRAYAWGGGHYGWIGADVDEYDVLTNRWLIMDDPVNYKKLWRHPQAHNAPGPSFQGWKLMGTHARKSYGVDVRSDTLITLNGDVYSLAEQRYVTRISPCPSEGGLGGQFAVVTTPHGLYGFSAAETGRLLRANVPAFRWEPIAAGGPSHHQESNHLCYDSKRDRLVYFGASRERAGEIWTFDFKTKTWRREEIQGRTLENPLGDSTYVPELDAALLAFAPGRGEPEQLYLYKLAEHRWYTAPAPYQGEPLFSKTTGRDSSPFHDRDLGVVVRLVHENRSGPVFVLVMRIEPDKLEMKPL